MNSKYQIALAALAGAALGAVAVQGLHAQAKPKAYIVTESELLDAAAEGDLNYDGSVTIADFIALASNFNQSYSGGANAIADGDRQLLASFASSVGADPSVIGSAVPEPGMMGLIAVGAVGLKVPFAIIWPRSSPAGKAVVSTST